jgi:hypothetical protein
VILGFFGGGGQVMVGLHSFDIDKESILAHLEEFEQFCLGKTYMSPEEVKELNETLSLGAIAHVGKYRFTRENNEVHLLWVSPDHHEHNLGPISKLNVMRDCPGFHRTRSLALGQEHVETSGQVHIPDLQTHVSMVKMKDGSTGYGPNYKVALRNAALKMHLKSAFDAANAKGLWKLFYSWT